MKVENKAKKNKVRQAQCLCDNRCFTAAVVAARSGFGCIFRTPDEPYQIANVEQLNNVRTYLDKHFILVGDIDERCGG